MDRAIHRLADETFDIAIIGGGVLGGFLAHEAARRGYRTALVEARDFASGTTSASGKVLHGGLRYLQHLEVGLAAEANREQGRIAELAPKLVRPLPFVVPARTGDLRESATMRLGALGWKITRPLMPGRAPLPSSDFLGRSELARLLGKERTRPFSGAMRFHDYQLRSPERLTVALICDAHEHGAVVANYTEAVGLRQTSDRIDGVEAVDRLHGREVAVRARMTVNAAGPGGAVLANSVDGSLQRTGFAKGVHVLLDVPEPPAAIALPLRGESSGSILGKERRIFLMPWEGRTLAGATYAPYRDDPRNVRPEKEEAEAFLCDLRREWPQLGLDDATPLFAYAGAYPIFEQDETGEDTFAASLRPRIVDHEATGGPAGIVSAVSVKLTGAWKLAEDTLTVVEEKLGEGGRAGRDLPSERELARARPGPTSTAAAVFVGGGDEDAELGALEGMIDAAVEREMARSLTDVLFRRTWMGHLGRPGDDRLRFMSRQMGRRLDWGAEEMAREVDRAIDVYIPVEGS